MLFHGNLLKYISPQDLKSFGLIPELIGRVSSQMKKLENWDYELIFVNDERSLFS